MNRRWSMPRTHRKRGSDADVGDDERLARLRDAAGHAFAERHPGPADLVAVEAVRRGERQVGSVPIEQVQRGDVRVERVAGPVDDGLEQLVPRPGGRREARDLVEEPELLELVRVRRAAARSRVRPWPHDTSVGARIRPRKVAGRRAGRGLRNGDVATFAARGSRPRARRSPACRRSDASRPRPTGPNVAVRAEPATVGTGRARDRLALEVRLLGSLLGQVIAEQAGRELLDLVERVRRTTIRLRRDNDPVAARGPRRRARRASTRTGPRSSSARSASTSAS